MRGAYATALGRASTPGLAAKAPCGDPVMGAPGRRRAGRAAAQETLSVNFMPLEACGSHWTVYVPFLSVTVTFLVPTNGTVVTTFLTPGPKMWKLCALDLSFTVIAYEPGLSVFTALPDFMSVIVKPGPTAPASGVAAVCPARAGAASARLAAATATAVRCFVRLSMRTPRERSVRLHKRARRRRRPLYGSLTA